MSKSKIPVIERMAKFIDASGPGWNGKGPCWNWLGCKVQGYGRTAFKGGTERAHRVTYEVFVGPIPDGLFVDHLCANRACCNPDHLEAVTNHVNVLRGRAGWNMRCKTHCPRGHEYDDKNTYWYKGGRTCRKCAVIKSQAWQARNKAVL
jgi:hypothetical protein